jgi:tRNA pseudouridine38-40 synthase
VLWAVPVAADFHARFSAHSRSYDYLLYSHPIRPALLAGRVGWFHAPLDVERMQQAAELLLGEHDFSCFRAAQCQAKTPVKTLTEASVERRGDLICLRFTANAFLHHMVRNMVGCLVYVGAGRQPVAWMETVLKARDRALAAPTFAPDGLYLVRVGYPQPIDIPAGSPILTASFQ